MFDFLKRKDKNNSKYTITHNGSIDTYDEYSFSNYAAYILKPVIVIKEDIIKKQEDRLKTITFNRDTLIDLRSTYVLYSKRCDKLHDKLSIFQSVDDDFWFNLSNVHPCDINIYYHINKDYLKKYAIACTEKLSLTLSSKEASITLDFKKLHYKTFDIDKAILDLMCWTIDIFENFEKEIVNQFADGIFDTLSTLLTLLDDKDCNSAELIRETRLYIKDVRETIISFGELIEEFENPFNLIRKKKEDEEKAKRDAEEKRRTEYEAYQSKHNDFLEKMKARRDLLKDFNEPLSNVPEKIVKCDEAIEKRWSKV